MYDPGPEPTIPEAPAKKAPPISAALLLVLFAAPAFAAELERIEYVQSPITPVVACPIGATCTAWTRVPGEDDTWQRGIQDGPDGIPTLKREVKPPSYPVWSSPWDGYPGRRERAPRVADETEVVEMIVELEPVEEVIGHGCQDSLSECEAQAKSTCKEKHPLARARAFNRVTKYEEGKACEFLCQTYSGELKGYGCVKTGTKPQPRPEETASIP